MKLDLLQGINENACQKQFGQALHIALNHRVESVLTEMTNGLIFRFTEPFWASLIRKFPVVSKAVR